MSKDQLFEIKLTPTQVFVRIAPPEGARRINLNIIREELKLRKIDYQIEHLFQIYSRASNDFELLANRELEHYEVQVDISPEAFQAHITINPPTRGDKQLFPKTIRQALENAGVKQGILQQELKRVIQQKVEGERVLIAQGRPAVQGEDGWISFNRAHQRSGRVALQDNRADYRELNLVQNVEEGYLVAKVFPSTRGEDGMTVKGESIAGSDGKPANFSLGKNLRIDEQSGEIRAEKAGIVVFFQQRLSVEDVLQLQDVDAQSGNIRFSGVVDIAGQVADGFTVEGVHGIRVQGTVGKALLRSRGEIAVGGGMLGSKVQAGGTVRARFLSECEVQAGECVIVSEYLLRSKVQAAEVVMVSNLQSGFIRGGVVWAGKVVFSPNLGTEASNQQTSIEVGQNFEQGRDFEHLQQRIGESCTSFDKLCKNIQVLQMLKEAGKPLEEKHERTLEKMIHAALVLRVQLLEQTADYHKLKNILDKNPDGQGFVLVSQNVYQGTRIRIKGFLHTVDSNLASCGFQIADDEMQVQGFQKTQRFYERHFGKLPS